jgi:hypothetical protein
LLFALSLGREGKGMGDGSGRLQSVVFHRRFYLERGFLPNCPGRVKGWMTGDGEIAGRAIESLLVLCCTALRAYCCGIRQFGFWFWFGFGAQLSSSVMLG